MSPGDLDGDGLNLLVVPLPIFRIARRHDQSVSEKGYFVWGDQLRFTTQDCQRFVALCEELALTLPNLGEFPLRSGVASTGLLREPGARRCQLDILVVVTTTEKILAFWERFQYLNFARNSDTVPLGWRVAQTGRWSYQ